MKNSKDYSKLDLREIENNLVENMVKELTTNRQRSAQLEPLYLELLKRGRLDIFKQACKQTAAIIFDENDKTKALLIQNAKNIRKYEALDTNNVINEQPGISLLAENDNYRMATITGDSMIEAGINDGDDIIIELTTEINHNDIGVFKFDDKIIVKRFLVKEGEVWLKPENRNYKPVKIDKTINFEIIGKVKSVIHRF